MCIRDRGYLAQHVDREFSTRKLGEALDEDHRLIGKVCEELRKHDILSLRRKGNKHLWRLKSGSSLVAADSKDADQATKAPFLVKHPQPEHASMSKTRLGGWSSSLKGGPTTKEPCLMVRIPPRKARSLG